MISANLRLLPYAITLILFLGGFIGFVLSMTIDNYKTAIKLKFLREKDNN